MSYGMSASMVGHWVAINARTKMGGDMIEHLRWDNMSFDVRCKWDWYFKYRAALIQVKHPRAHVEFLWGHEQAKGALLENIHKNRIRAKKGKITEVENKLQKAREIWNELFPIEDYEPYQRACSKLFNLKNELRELEEQS